MKRVQRCSIKKDVFRNFAKFTAKHLCHTFSRVFSGPYFLALGLNTRKYVPKKASYLDNTFHAVMKSFSLIDINTPSIFSELNIYYFLTWKFLTEAVIPMCYIKKGVLRNFTKFTGKHKCQSFFFNKVAGLSCPWMSLLQARPLDGYFCFGRLDLK